MLKCPANCCTFDAGTHSDMPAVQTSVSALISARLIPADICDAENGPSVLPSAAMCQTHPGGGGGVVGVVPVGAAPLSSLGMGTPRDLSTLSARRAALRALPPMESSDAARTIAAQPAPTAKP